MKQKQTASLRPLTEGTRLILVFFQIVGVTEGEDVGIYFLERALYAAETVLAVFTSQTDIGAVPEPFGVARVYYLPAYQHYAGGEKQAPSEEARHKKHWGIHHKMTPVVNAAVDAAAVFHDERLEGAVYQHTYKVAHKIKERKENHFRFAYDAKKKQQGENRIKAEPEKHDLPGLYIHYLNEPEKLIAAELIRRDIFGRAALSSAHCQAAVRQDVGDHT